MLPRIRRRTPISRSWYGNWSGIASPSWRCIRRPPLTRIEQRVAAYRTYLEQVRGFAPGTVAHHGRTVSEFLAHIGYETRPTRLAALERQDLDTFLCAVSPRQSRATLQHVVGHLRAFLRFLAADGEIPTGLDTQIDTPRVYRGEKLPRALPWDTVRALLDSIDRATPMGRRDYAIFLLMATYGLRACEVVTLTLDDMEWRAGRLRIPQRKTRGSLWLPLTDEVGTALLDYLRHGRHALNVRRQRVPFRGGPPRSYRELFSPLPHPDRRPQADCGHRGLPGVVEAKRPRHSVPGPPLRAALLRGAPLAVRPVGEDHRGPPGPSHPGKHVRVPPLGS